MSYTCSIRKNTYLGIKKVWVPKGVIPNIQEPKNVWVPKNSTLKPI